MDIGTNSTRLLIADVEDGHVHSLHGAMEITRLGRNVDRDRILSEEAIKETTLVINDFCKVAREYKSEHIIAVATSAVRDASNSSQFLEYVLLKSGIKICILSGIREAELSYIGVMHSLTDVKDGDLVCDAGGGSTEFISKEKAFSLDIGAVRITELFLHSDPPTALEESAAREYIRKVLNKEMDFISSFSRIIAVGGTITTLAAMNQNLEKYDPEKTHLSKIKRCELRYLIEKMLKLKLEEKKQLVGLQPKRADVILGGALIFDEIMEQFGFSEIIVSESDILQGIALEYTSFS